MNTENYPETPIPPFELWQYYRTEIHREHELVAARTSWMMMFHSMAMAAFAISSSSVINLLNAQNSARWFGLFPHANVLAAIIPLALTIGALRVTFLAKQAINQAGERLEMWHEKVQNHLSMHDRLSQQVNAGFWTPNSPDMLAVKGLRVPAQQLPQVFVWLWSIAGIYSLAMLIVCANV